MKRLVAFCLGFALSLNLPVSAAAEAEVDFNFSTNTGFVPVASVQFLLGLSNGQIKKYARGVSFPVLLWSTRDVHCDDGTETNISFGEGFDVVPSLVQSRGQLVGFQLSGVIENHFIADPFPIEELCSGVGTLDTATTVTRTLMTGFGEETVILLQEIEVVGD